MHPTTIETLASLVDQRIGGVKPSDGEAKALLQDLSRILTPEALKEFRSAWIRREIAKAEASGPPIPAEQVFDELEAKLKARYPELAGQ